MQAATLSVMEEQDQSGFKLLLMSASVTCEGKSHGSLHGGKGTVLLLQFSKKILHVN